MEVRVQLQCCVDDLASRATRHGYSAAGYGQCLGESSLAVRSGKGPQRFETATYRECHGEVMHSHTGELEGMKLAAKTSDRQIFRSVSSAS